jgi:hypothetical protein
MTNFYATKLLQNSPYKIKVKYKITRKKYLVPLERKPKQVCSNRVCILGKKDDMMNLLFYGHYPD